jgi:hypothetical protein
MMFRMSGFGRERKGRVVEPFKQMEPFMTLNSLALLKKGTKPNRNHPL